MAARGNKSRFAIPELGKTPGRRPVRVADAVMSEVAMLLVSKVKDPRLQRITITSVQVTNDLRKARVYFNCAKDQINEVIKGLERAKGFIRSHLAKKLGLRYVPELLFEYDLKLDKQSEMEKIFQEISEEHDTASQ